MKTAFLVLALAVGGVAGADKIVTKPEEMDVVSRVIKANSKKFSTCFSRELSRDPKVARGGKVVLAVTLDKDGGVTSARVESTTLNHKTIEDCVVREMKALKFSSEARRTFSYPFIFAAAG